MAVATLFILMAVSKSVSDLDMQAKTSVETSVDPVVHTVMDSFFQADPVPGTGEFSAGAMPVVEDSSSVIKFLSRPLLMDVQTWAHGGTMYMTLNPWEYLRKPSVRTRVSHYARFRGDLVLKVVVNGTPMHYGLVRVCYRPHPLLTSTSDPVFNHATATEAGNFSRNLKIVASQLDGFYINPCRDAGGELRIPFMSPKPGIELGYGLSDISKMGTVYTIGFAPLANASASTGPVTLEFYVHCENVVLDVPTAIPQGYTLQDAANFTKRVLRATSKATTIANEWAPRALSAIAMLGFSRPMAHELAINTRQIPYNLSNYDEADTCTTLALSAAAEHTLGGQELGTTGADELLLSSIAARASYLIQADWSTSNTIGHFLLGSVVTPVQNSVSTYTKVVPGGATYAPRTHACMIPCSFAANVAEYWRATMVYKFTVVASPYHKGRLRIYYDPYPHSEALGPPTMNLTNSIIIDLAQSSTAVIEVPWQNVRDMAVCGSPFITNTFNTEHLFASRCSSVLTSSCNGIITCEVLSPLTGLVDETIVSVLLEVSAKDMVLFSPRLYRHTVDGLDRPMAMDGGATPYVPQSYDVTGGDAIVSLRQVMKRYTSEYSGTLVCTTVSGPNLVAASLVLPVSLPVPGFPLVLGTPDSDDTSRGATDIQSADALPVSYTGLAFHTYIATAFAMVRGSIRWKFLACAPWANAPRVSTSLGRYTKKIPPIDERRVLASSYTNATAGTLGGIGARSRALSAFRRADLGMQITPYINGGAGTAVFDVDRKSVV